MAKEVSVKNVPKQFQGTWMRSGNPYPETITNVGEYVPAEGPDSFKTLKLVLVDATHLQVTLLGSPDEDTDNPGPSYKLVTTYELKGNKLYTITKRDGKTYRFGPYSKKR